MSGEPLPGREAFAAIRPIATRWMDNDVYGHVNNVIYYSFFDTAVNAHLIEERVLDPVTSPAIGLVIETGCRYAAPISFPDRVDAGIRVSRIGRSSVRYEIGLFRNDEAEACAFGHFTHVYVDRQSRRPVEIPAAVRAVLEALAR